ncbi:MAG: hypothetical protein QW796_01895 [Thermoproteota archaeon]
MIASMRYCGGDGHAIEEADRIGEEAGERAGRETGWLFQTLIGIL